MLTSTQGISQQDIYLSRYSRYLFSRTPPSSLVADSNSLRRLLLLHSARPLPFLHVCFLWTLVRMLRKSVSLICYISLAPHFFLGTSPFGCLFLLVHSGFVLHRCEGPILLHAGIFQCWDEKCFLSVIAVSLCRSPGKPKQHKRGDPPRNERLSLPRQAPKREKKNSPLDGPQQRTYDPRHCAL
ncbi:hypothetical protein LY76DRAFT_295265 [Colletotrichum caudatum]|nr:hypothetical protein LY76DRAFT_295265 [Colletotrichum caudatum]